MQPDDGGNAGRERPISWWIALGLVLLVAAVYGQTLGFGFLDYDDYFFVGGCRQVRGGLSASGISWAFTSGPFGEWYPLAMLSHMLDCQLFGLGPAWHHLTNVLLHAAATVGLFWVWQRMTGALWPSAAVAAVFAVHPQHVESVAWIAERRDVLSGLFFVLTLAAYLHYVRKPSVGRYCLVALMLALGLMAKAMLVSVPGVLLLLDYWPLGRFGDAGQRRAEVPALPRVGFWRLVLEKLPLAALALADGVITLATHAKNPHPIEQGWLDGLANSAVALVMYVFQFFCPVDLAVFYPPPAGGYPAWAVAGAAALIVATSALAIVVRRRQPYFTVGWFWFVGMIAPVLGLIHMPEHTRADRYMYLPSIGLSIAVVWGVAAAIARWRPSRLAVAGCAAVVIGALVSQAVQQTATWRDDLSLWTHALETTGSSGETEYSLGYALAKAGRLDEATEHYQHAGHFRTDENLLDSMAAVALRQGKADEAARLLRQAIAINPAAAKVQHNYGIVLRGQGDYAGAAQQYRRAIELDPDYVDGQRDLGILLLHDGQVAEAKDHLTRAVELEPDDVPARVGLAIALAELGQTAEAITHCRHALAISPHDKTAQTVLDKLLHHAAEGPAQ